MPVIWLKVYKGKQKLNNYTNSYLLTVAKRTGKANIMCSKNLRTGDNLDGGGAVSWLESGSDKSAVWEMVTGGEKCLWESHCH